MKQLRQQQGFTMIELIMVIVILGVLSAFALPRFADLGGSARAAAIEGLAGSMRSAVGITRAQWYASGETNCATPPVSTANSVCLDGSVVTVEDGYPVADNGGAADLTGIILAAGLATTNDSGAALASGGTSQGYTYTFAADTLTITSKANCEVVYTKVANSAPTIVSDTSGC
ncbi:MAG: type II secretion system protein [Pseudomonadota bacterium]|nr:type II secretion system protein [Pseudomonadota bacterium]